MDIARDHHLAHDEDFKEESSAESAGEHIVRRVPRAYEDEPLTSVLERVTNLAAADQFGALDAVYVTDRSDRFLGAVRLADLFASVRRKRVGTPIGAVADRTYPRVSVHHDQEHVADEALRQRATSVAVVDEDDSQRLIGAVSALSLLDILRKEHVEDLHRLAGIQREQARDQSALEAPPTRRARHRLPWLLFGLAGSMLAAIVVSRFERVLERQMAVAFFVPAIVYLADAIGTQTEAIVVRGLSLSRLSLRHMLGGEARTGLLIGATLAAFAFPLVVLVFNDVRLAAAVSLAILVAGSVATTVGLLLPWLLQRLGSDPAFGSGPVATIIQDVLSLVIYFVIATLVLPAR